MNANILSYVIRLDVYINNIVRLPGRLSHSVYHEIITGLQELKDLLSRGEQARQPVRAGYSTPRMYTGCPGQPQFYIA